MVTKTVGSSHNLM